VGIGVWGATIIKSLGFTAIREPTALLFAQYETDSSRFLALGANLLSVPSPIIGLGTSFILAFLVDRYRRYGYAIIFSGIWTLVGLIALYVRRILASFQSILLLTGSPTLQSLPIISSGGSWGFYAALIYTLSAPGWQPVSSNFHFPSRPARRSSYYPRLPR
jgi:hypothetical protein